MTELTILNPQGLYAIAKLKEDHGLNIGDTTSTVDHKGDIRKVEIKSVFCVNGKLFIDCKTIDDLGCKDNYITENFASITIPAPEKKDAHSE